MEAIERTPWPPGFPDVVVHMDLKARNQHPAYAAAKSGDAVAAYALASDVLNEMLIDDHVGFGGTLANLRGYIEAQGGRVIGMTTLTETSRGHKIAPRPQTLSVLKEKHGQELNQFWNGVFGYSTACLTDIEAG